MTAGLQDSSDLCDGLAQLVVHHDGVELAGLGLFGRGGFQPTPHLVGIVTPALTQPGLLHGPIRRGDYDFPERPDLAAGLHRRQSR